MKIKGIDKFQEKVPILSGKKIFLLPLYVFFIVLLCILVMIGFYSLPSMTIFSGINPILLSLFPLAGQVIICIIGLTLLYQIWFWKDRLRAKYGPLSYQHIFLVGFAGISCLFSAAVTLFIPYWSFSLSFWINSPLKFLTIPLEEYLYSLSTLVFWLRIIFSVFFSVLGITMIIRALQTFGADYMSVIYLYFPEESKLINHKIYSVLRHPTYAGYLLFGLGGVFFTFTLYSIIFYLVYLACFYVHIHFVEEKELIMRFGPSYQEYIKKVPAFFVNPDKLRVLLSFLLRRSDNRS
jgi:protein-S-isoprenylcysteine O-methyltransferase Ste14